MPDSKVTAKRVIQKMREQLDAVVVKHQALTTHATVASQLLGQITSESADISKLSETQDIVASCLRVALYDLEAIILRAEVSGKLIACLGLSGLDHIDDAGLRNLSRLCDDYCLDHKLFRNTRFAFQGGSTATIDALTELGVCLDDLFAETASDEIQRLAERLSISVSELHAMFDDIDEHVQIAYREFLLQQLFDLSPADMRIWVARNVDLVHDLETCTTRHRENIGLWQSRTQFAFGRQNECLATQAWRRKELYGQTLSRLEAALVAHVEAGVVIRDRLEQLSGR